jgi:hypothetical protein
MDRRNFLQFDAIGGITSKLLEGCSPVANSQTTNKKPMSEVYLQQSPANLAEITFFAGKYKTQLEEFLHRYMGEIYVACIDRSDRNKQISQGFLPSPQKIGENNHESIIQLPKKDIVIVGIIKELDQTPQVIILETFQRHSVFSVVYKNENYIRDDKNWNHSQIVEVPFNIKSVSAETFHSVLVPAREVIGNAQYFSPNNSNGGQIVNQVPKEGHILQSLQGENIKEGVLVQGGGGVVSRLKLK